MIWEPSPEFIRQTNVWRFMERLGFSDREAFLRFSRESPERFWDETMREMRVEWFEPYRQVTDRSPSGQPALSARSVENAPPPPITTAHAMAMASR